MFSLFRRNVLYNESIEPHCAYCAHCKPDNEYQGVCDYRGIVAMAGSCRRFEYDALRRKPPKPARIRGRFTDADFFFEEKESEEASSLPAAEPTPAPKKPLISDDLSQFADLWEDDDDTAAPEASEAVPENEASTEAPEDTSENEASVEAPEEDKEESTDEM